MVKYDKIFLVIGLILSIFPFYIFITWVYVFEKYSYLNYQEIVTLYNKKILFNLFESGNILPYVIFLCIRLIAGIILFLSIINSLKYGAKHKILKFIVFIINFNVTSLILLSLL